MPIALSIGLWIPTASCSLIPCSAKHARSTRLNISRLAFHKPTLRPTDMISPGSPRDKPSSPRPRLPPQPDINATSNNRQQLSGIPRLSGGPRIPGHVQDWLNELATFSQFGSPNLSQAPIADLATLQQQLDAMDLARTEGQVPQQATDSTTQTYIAAAPAPSVNVQPPAPTTELSGAALLQLLQAQWAQQVPAPAPPQVNEHGARAQQALHQRMQQTAANQAGLPPANRPIWGAAPSTAYMPQVQVPVPPMVWPTIVQASQATYRQPLTSVEQLHVKLLSLPVALRAPFLDKALLEPCLAASFQQSPSAPANLGSVRWGNAHDAPAFGANSDDLNTILNTMEQAVRAEAPITPAATAADSAAPALSSDDAAPAAHHEALTLSLLPEYDTYPSEAGTIARMVVSLKAGMVGKARAPVSLTCVLDRSGSMSGPRLTLLRETVSFLIEQLGSDDLLGLVSYSDSVLEDLPLVGMSAGGKALAHAVVARLQASGGTALYAGTLAGLQQQSTGSVRPSPGNSPSLSQLFGCPPPMTARPMRLDSAATVRYDAGPQPNGADTATLATPAATGDNAWCKGYVRAVLLCTDGEATHGPRSADDMLPALRREQEGWSMGPPLTLHTFGIGSGHDARLLQAMSESQAGQYYDIASAADIPETYGDVLGGLLSVVAKDVQLSIMPASGSGLQLTALQCGGKVTQPATTDGGAHQVAYGDVFAEESKDAMLMLKLPSAMHATGTAAGPAEVLLTVTLSYTNCNSGGAVNAEQAVHVLRGVRPQNAEACEEVLVTAARYATADALRAATAAAASGQQAQAQQVMQQQTAALQALHSRVSTTAGVAGLLPSAGIAGGSLGMVNMLLATAQSGYQQVQQAPTCTSAMMSANSSALVNQRGALSMSMRPPPPGFGAPPGFGGPAAWAARQPTSLAYGFDSSSRQSMRSAAVQSVTARAPTRNPPN